MNTAVLLFVLFGCLKIFGGFVADQLIKCYTFFYGLIGDVAREEMNLGVSMSLFAEASKRILLACLPILGFGVLGAFIVNRVQVKWKVTAKPLKPKLSKISPISGFKRLFSKDKLVELLKAVLKLAILFYVIYVSLKDEWGMITNLYQISLLQGLRMILDMVLDVSFKICIAFAVLAFADWFYQKKKFSNDMKMTKQEVKDEYKNAEGDPQIKGKIRQKMREVSQRRMMQDLTQADVVITNPTHFAVAIKYTPEAHSAPVVVAKGADYLAQKIKGIARENGIEIVENKPLARMLYANVDVGQEVPPELYQAVAEVLAMVYKMQGKL